MRTLTNDELADELEAWMTDGNVDILTEAVRRLRERDFQQLQTINEMASAIADSPLIDERSSKVAEQIITAIPVSRKGFSRVASLGDRIIRGATYDDADVRELAAYAASTADSGSPAGQLPAIDGKASSDSSYT